MLVDTCAWLGVAKDPRPVAVVGVIEEMVKQKLVELMVPRIVLGEFRRNRERIAKESAAKSGSSRRARASGRPASPARPHPAHSAR